MSLLLETSLGDLVIDLDIEGSPELCKNVLHLATARFYTNTLITPIVPGRTARCGDPVGDGSGGTSIYGLLDNDSGATYMQSQRRCLADTAGRTLTAAERREKGRVVAICMVDTTNGQSIPNSMTSQFCITLADGPEQALDGLSPTSFRSLGVVVEDEQNVLDQLNDAYIDPAGRPYADIRIRRALVIHDPFSDERPNGMEAYLDTILTRGSSGRVLSSPSPDRPTEEKVPRRIRVEDVLVGLQRNKNGEDDDVSMNSAEEEAAWNAQVQREKEEEERRADKSRAVVLEMLGDVPDAEMKAPEDVLFLCKLNPETMDEDLELIFSRFDEKVKVEIIRDADTGASLQYAFAEFTSKQAAEEAYLKMDNALVDDRRIKVDFSQSVSKLWDKYNQKMRMPKSFRSEPQASKQQHRNPPPRNNSSHRRLPPPQQRRSHDNQQHYARHAEDYRQRPDDSYHRSPDRRNRDYNSHYGDERHGRRKDRNDESDEDYYRSRSGHHHRSSRHRRGDEDEKRSSSKKKRGSRHEDSSDGENGREHHREDDRRSHGSRDKRRPSRRDVSVSDDESHRRRHRRRRSRSRSRSNDGNDHKKRRHRGDEEENKRCKKHKKERKHRKHEKRSRRERSRS